MTNFKEKSNRKVNGKLMLYGAGAIMLMLMFLTMNPFGYNDLGYREIVEAPTGAKSVVFSNGVYFKIPGSKITTCLLYTSPSPRDKRQSRMPSSA